MTITEITELHNKEMPKPQPVKEKMNIFIEGVPEGIARRNGAIYLVCGPPGSGKSSFMLSLFRSRKLYRCRFHHLHLFVPMSSFLSVKNNPFEEHDKIYHELTPDAIYGITAELEDIKEEHDEDEDEDYESSCIVIDDFASELKQKDIEKALTNLLIRTRHLNCMVIITSQNYNMIPMKLRKMVTFASIWKPRTKKEWESICSELLKYEHDDAQKIYDFVFSEPYSHLDIDSFEDKFYKNNNPLVIEDTNKL